MCRLIGCHVVFFLCFTYTFMSTCFVIHEHDLSMLTRRHDEGPDPPKTM